MSQTNRRPYAPPKPAGQAPQRPAPKRRAGRLSGIRPELVKIGLGGLAALAVALLLEVFFPGGFRVAPQAQNAAALEPVAEIFSPGPLRVNEVMSANRRCLAAADGSSPDWIEIANVGAEAVDLDGYALAKTENDTNSFHFPEYWLEPGESVVVLADSRLREDASGEFHAPFRLSSQGDTLMLFNARGTAIDTLNLPALGADQSYARMDTALWQRCDTPTPGQPNTEAGYRALTEPSGDSPVVVTELMAVNRSAHSAADGAYYDYIELYNRGGEAVNLRGWYLSDDRGDARKWSFPDVTLQPGQYLVVYASGLDVREGELHTNFGLSSEGEEVCLSDARGRLLERVEFDLLKADEAWSLSADGSWRVAPASPGAANP